ncbi:hypothetical protein [Bradyrhizobium sp. STM 3562]|uniref:hypothetical protein n=1 Tax=Bradyrhizobium sp. STM 3562 TaxID=578924 RepID=UPI00388D31BD
MSFLIRSAVMGAVLLAAGFCGEARAQAVVEDPGYCAQYYPNANCQNYGPGNPLYPGSYGPAGPPRAYAAPMPVRPYYPHRHHPRHHR